MSASEATRTWLVARAGGLSVRLPRRVVPVAAVLLALLVLAAVLSTAQGEYRIAPFDVVKTVLGLDTGDPNHALVVRQFRLPRIVLAALVGGALGMSGAVLQGMTRNGLAEPGILGISQGAGLAAVAFLTLAPSAPGALLQWVALLGGLFTAAAVYLLAWKDGASPVRLILVGIGVSAVATALTTYLIVLGDITDVQRALLWLTGSVYGRDWEHVKSLAIWLLVLAPAALLGARALNVQALGEPAARSLGQRVNLVRTWLVVVAVALACGAVAVAGAIAFVGLVAPHAARRLVGPSHEALLPVSALLGALLLLVADLIGRTVIAPSQLPVGIVTAVVGAPYLIYLLLRERRS